MNLRLQARFITFILLISLLSSSAKSAESYTFGIVPQQSASKLAKLWGPILQEISEQSGIRIQFATAPDIPTFERRLSEGIYDFSYMNPYHFTIFNQKPGYKALVKAKDKLIKGIIVVRKDSPIDNLEQLNQLAIAFPAPAAFAASILPRAHLAATGINIRPHYVSSHDSVYLTVAKGIYSAGGGVMRTFNNMDKSTKDKLRILWTTKGYTPHAIAAHPRISPEISDTMQKVLVNLADSSNGKELLEKIKIKGFTNANDADWDDVRRLSIDLLNDLQG
ncbi:MAG: phosphate/phosphite/phosphonate ABC transporter substrate-binding protein [Gammaproteobacteria bacterium]|nr:phosphate/phosphite/phosphonate ABC transporter substrate-binding protein [Gammaproteobacteria bacterium]